MRSMMSTMANSAPENYTWVLYTGNTRKRLTNSSRFVAYINPGDVFGWRLVKTAPDGWTGGKVCYELILKDDEGNKCCYRLGAQVGEDFIEHECQEASMPKSFRSSVVAAPTTNGKKVGGSGGQKFVQSLVAALSPEKAKKYGIDPAVLASMVCSIDCKHSTDDIQLKRFIPFKTLVEAATASEVAPKSRLKVVFDSIKRTNENKNGGPIRLLHPQSGAAISKEMKKVAKALQAAGFPVDYHGDEDFEFLDVNRK